jgi:hydrogenase expression/formation protein HypD
VCVTPAEILDHAVALARRPEVVLCSYGDMLRVPGRASDLRTAKAEGADVRVVYSALDTLARTVHDREIVFFAVGFETTVERSPRRCRRCRASATAPQAGRPREGRARRSCTSSLAICACCRHCP